MWNFVKGAATAAISARLYRRYPWLVLAMWAWNFYQNRKAHTAQA